MSSAGEFGRNIFFKHIGKQVSNDGTDVKNLIKRSFHSRLLFSVSCYRCLGPVSSILSILIQERFSSLHQHFKDSSVRVSILSRMLDCQGMLSGLVAKACALCFEGHFAQ